MEKKNKIVRKKYAYLSTSDGVVLISQQENTNNCARLWMMTEQMWRETCNRSNTHTRDMTSPARRTENFVRPSKQPCVRRNKWKRQSVRFPFYWTIEEQITDTTQWPASHVTDQTLNYIYRYQKNAIAWKVMWLSMSTIALAVLTVDRSNKPNSEPFHLYLEFGRMIQLSTRTCSCCRHTHHTSQIHYSTSWLFRIYSNWMAISLMKKIINFLFT